MQNRLSVLIVDDQPAMRLGLEQALVNDAQRIDVASDASDAFAKFQSGDYEVVISGGQFIDGGDGLSLVSQMLSHRPDTTAIVVTPVGLVEMTADMSPCSSSNFITKPIDSNAIGHQVQKVVERHRLLTEIRRLKDQLAGFDQISKVIGTSPCMQTVLSQVRQVAASSASVLIHGEVGTGKEMIARTIHELSNNSHGSFEAIDLPTLPDSLFEEHLFGRLTPSSHSALRKVVGRAAQAEGGTLFLKSLSDLNSSNQRILLKMLETEQYRPLNSDVDFRFRSRVVSSTHCELRSLVLDKSFRADLFERLNTVAIKIPPLRERGADIPMLIEHYLRHFCDSHKRAAKDISAEAVQVLCQADWPGNVRQLSQVIERLVVSVRAEKIETSDLPIEIFKGNHPSEIAVKSLADATEKAERSAIHSALEACNHHREHAAKALGISVRTLHYKMSRYGIH